MAGSLTRRETAVLDELLLGHPNKVLTQNLGCALRTVEAHVTSARASDLARDEYF